MIWMASPELALPAGTAALGSSETLRLSETLPVSETLPPHRPPLKPAPAPARRRGQVAADVEAVLPELPEEFEKQDVVRALGYEPPRATLYRVLEQLVLDFSGGTCRYLGRTTLFPSAACGTGPSSVTSSPPSCVPKSGCLPEHRSFPKVRPVDIGEGV